jgi:hypothetical protein
MNGGEVESRGSQSPINSHGKPKKTEIMVLTQTANPRRQEIMGNACRLNKFSAFSNVASFEENLLTILPPPFQHKLSPEKLITCIDCKVYNLSNDANFIYQ